MRIELGNETVVETATQDDVDYVEANYRAGERAEHEALGGGRTLVGEFEDCWAIRHGGRLIGYCGVAIPQGMTVFGPGRWLCYMSCRNADCVKFTYVKMSRKVMAAIVARTPAHAVEFRSLPAAEYVASVKWHERVLGMHRLGTATLGGKDHVLFGIMRKEVLG